MFHMHTNKTVVYNYHIAMYERLYKDKQQTEINEITSDLNLLVRSMQGKGHRHKDTVCACINSQASSNGEVDVTARVRTITTMSKHENEASIHFHVCSWTRGVVFHVCRTPDDEPTLQNFVCRICRWCHWESIWIKEVDWGICTFRMNNMLQNMYFGAVIPVVLDSLC